MSVNIGIPAKELQAVANELQKILADEFILYTKTRNYHWNVEGNNFMELHKFYESQYEALDEIMDEVAERIRMLGHYSEARLKDFIQLSRLDEPAYTSDQKQQLQNLLSDHEILIQTLRKDINAFSDQYKDLGTADFVTGLLRHHEKSAWFIRSYLK
jgi:starvation-inducible DNA-binding protein